MKQEKLKLLIVDDSVIVGKRLRNLLSPFENISIVGHAENFKEASIILQSMQPDVILLDIEMPGKSGIDLLTEIRLMHSHAKVIMCTNYVNPYSKNLCLQLGADYFLDKSNEFEQIPSLLKQWAN